MKKLMIAAAVAMVGIAANAAAYTWKSSTNYTYLPETTTKAAGQAYLFNVGTYSQAQLLAYFAENGAINTAKSVQAGGQAMSGGQVKEGNKFTYDGVAVGSNWTGYFAMIVDDKLYISSTKADIAATDLEAGTSISFTSQASTSKAKALDASEYKGAGWYTAVPEPTSGLLLLLGVAGLALRRRRA